MAEGPYEGQLPLSAIEVDEDLWGPGSAPIVKQWLRDNYDPDTMPRLVTSTIQGREGYWLLGWRSEDTSWPSLLSLVFGEEYAVARLEQNKADIAERNTTLCPRCHFNRFTPYGTEAREEQIAEYPFPALSRMDNATYICTPCGNEEAMRDFQGQPPIPVNEWPVGPLGSFGAGKI